MMLSPLRVLALLSGLLAWWPATGAAVEVAGLFEAAVPVANQGAGERKRAVAEGFRQVLVKASGQRAVLSNPAVQQELGKAESLLGSWRYETVKREPGAGPVAATPEASPRIRLAFDAGSVLGVLNRAGAPVWSASRPQVFLWVTREGPAATVFALGTTQAEALVDMAGQRGLPVVVPPPGAVPVAVAEGTPVVVSGMAARAGAQVVLAARLSAAAGKVRATGFLKQESAEQCLEVTAAGEEEALRELLAAAADHLGGLYGAVARQDQVNTVRLRVDGVATLADWAALERWLLSQPLVRDAVIATLDPEGTDYVLVLAGDIDRLMQAMRGDGRFSQVGAPEGDGLRLVARLATPGGP